MSFLSIVLLLFGKVFLSNRSEPSPQCDAKSVTFHQPFPRDLTAHAQNSSNAFRSPFPGRKHGIVTAVSWERACAIMLGQCCLERCRVLCTCELCELTAIGARAELFVGKDSLFEAAPVTTETMNCTAWRTSSPI